MMLWNTGLAQGNTETNELGYSSGLKRIFYFQSVIPYRTMRLLRLLHMAQQTHKKVMTLIEI